MPEIKEAAKKYPSADAFFKAKLPATLYRDKDLTFMQILRRQGPPKEAKHTLTFGFLKIDKFKLTILHRDKKWYVSFPMDYYPEFILKMQREGKQIPIMLSIDNTPLENVVPVFARPLTCTIKIKESNRYKPVTLHVQSKEHIAKKFTPKAAWDLFIGVLKRADADFRVEGNKVLVSPKQDISDIMGQLAPAPKEAEEDAQPVKHKHSGRKTPEEMKNIRQQILKKMMERRRKEQQQ